VKKRILFTDDEPMVLLGLKRMLRSQRDEWEMAFAGSGAEALALLEKGHFEVVVSDMRMPGMDGAEFLTTVMRRYPDVVRIILSGSSEWELIMKSVGPAHQYLNKPCNADELKATIAQACALRTLLADHNLRTLVSRMETLPSLPSLYQRILKALRSPDASCSVVGEIVSQDPAMAAKVLQLVNSAFFGLARPVTKPSQAVSLLGLDTVKSLVLSLNMFAEFDQRRVTELSLDSLWTHCLAVGSLAKRIAHLETDNAKLRDDALLAGLLHDIGKLVLVANLPDAYAEVHRRATAGNVDPLEAERQEFGATHGEVGAYLLGLWALPDPIVEAVAFHHQPSRCLSHGFTPLTAVHAANCLEMSVPCEDPSRIAPAVDRPYLDGLGLTERIDAWQELSAPLAQETATV